MVHNKQSMVPGFLGYDTVIANLGNPHMPQLRHTAVSTLVAATLAGSLPLLAPQTAQAELSGNIGVHSMYLLRGIFEENDSTAVQGGLDYASESGFYAGWWFSNLGYSYDAATATVSDGSGMENDFYAGFSGSVGDFGYGLGLIQYVYINVDNANLTEATATLSYSDFYVGAQYLLTDGWWGNQGDIYWKAGYSAALPKNFDLAVDLGYYTYNNDDNAKLCNPSPAGCGATAKDSGFRHLNFTLSHPIGNTGADMYVQYTVAGEDRTGKDYDNKVVAGITYGFDI